MNGTPSVPSIALRGVVVKQRLPDAFKNPDFSPRGSAFALFHQWVELADATENGVIVIKLDEWGYSRTTVNRAIAWLQRRHLLMKVESGGGRGNGSRYFVRWSFNGRFYKSTQTPPKKVNPTNTVHPSLYKETPKNKPLSPTGQAPCGKLRKPLRWAMSQLRREVNTYPLSPSRRARLLSGLGSALWRAMQRGDVQVGPQLGSVIRNVIAQLRRACGVSTSLRSACSFGGWAIRTVLDERETAKTERVASERLVEEIRKQKEKSRGGLQAFLDEVGAANLRECIRFLVRAKVDIIVL